MRSLLLLLLFVSAITTHAAIVTYSGYVTDVLCYDKCVVSGAGCNKCALDKTNVITAPQDHTVHCIRDVQACIDTGFFLTVNVGTTGAPNYAVKYKFDGVGNTNVLRVIKATSQHAGLQVSATGEDTNDGYLRNAVVVECTSGYCDGNCTSGNCVYTGTTSGRQGPVDHNLVLLHGSLLLISWAFLAPMAFVIKRNPTTLSFLNLSTKVCGYPLAFLLHVIMMLTAVVFTIVGVTIALVKFDRRALYGHYPLGLVVLAIVAFQPLPALICRPEHGQPRRKYFNWVHWIGGGLALALGAVNVILGTLNYRTLWDNCVAPSFIFSAFGGIGLTVVLGIVLEVIRCKQAKPEVGAAHAESSTDVEVCEITGIEAAQIEAKADKAA